MPPPMKRAADRNAPANPLTKPKSVEYNTDRRDAVTAVRPVVSKFLQMTVRGRIRAVIAHLWTLRAAKLLRKSKAESLSSTFAFPSFLPRTAGKEKGSDRHM